MDALPTEPSPTAMVRRPLDLTAYHGMQLQFTCRAKAAKVSRPPESYNGVKFMLHFKSPSLGSRWHNVSQIHGTFDWKELSFVAPIPDDAAQGELNLGLQNSTGTVWFDDIVVVVARGAAPQRPAPMANPPPPFKGHNLPRLRGVMSPNTFRDEDLRVLGQEWRANLIAGVFLSVKSIALIEEKGDKDYAYSGLVLNLFFAFLYLASMVYCILKFNRP